MDDTPPRYYDDDEHDDLAVTGPEPSHDGGYLDERDATSDGADLPTFTVTNPPGTVTVTALLDGRVCEIELAPKVTTLTEAMLAEEIVVIARLATQDAKAAQYSFMLEGMSQHGQHDVSTRDFLERDLHLPSPEQAIAARATVFSQRYASDDE